MFTNDAHTNHVIWRIGSNSEAFFSPPYPTMAKPYLDHKAAMVVTIGRTPGILTVHYAKGTITKLVLYWEGEVAECTIVLSYCKPPKKQACTQHLRGLDERHNRSCVPV